MPSSIKAERFAHKTWLASYRVSNEWRYVKAKLNPEVNAKFLCRRDALQRAQRELKSGRKNRKESFSTDNRLPGNALA